MSGPPAAGAWALVLHGGAKEIPTDRLQANRDGCLNGLKAGQAILEGGGTALDAVEAVVRVLEDDPTFNAGYGSVLNEGGEVELDAAIMDGRTLALGGIAAAQGLRHPVSVARLMLAETSTLIAGTGARLFAEKHGAEVCDPEDMICHSATTSEADAGHDTVGCVALDVHGDIAAATSTGGLTNCARGRVGDSPLPGCGLYADNLVGGVSFSGDGESISRLVLSARLLHYLELRDAQGAIEAALKLLPRVGGEAGGIVIDREGRIGWAHNSRHFAVGYATSRQPEPHVFMSKEEEGIATL